MFQYDPTDPATLRDPYPLFARLQDEDPVHWSESLRSWVVTRYDDARRVTVAQECTPDRLTPFYESLHDARREILSEVMRYLRLWLVFRDPPEHTRLRRLLNSVFNPETVKAMRPAVEHIVDHVLDAVDPSQPVDIATGVAVLVPGYVIIDLLGIPRERFPEIKRWSDDMRTFIGTARAEGDRYRRAQSGSHHMAAMFRELIAERRTDPGEDLVSRMILARDERGTFTEDELVATSMLFLFGGHETTTNLISNAVNALLDFPDQLERLRRDPSLIVTAVEEFLRYEGPSHSIARAVRVEHELGGRLLRTGDRVFAMINAANRDPRRFDDPQRLDLGRHPNRHLTFGSGIHFCIGAPLARLEGQVCLNRLVERFPQMRRDSAEPAWIDAMIMRGFESLPVRLA